jgi:hypothetical protein
LSRLQHQESRRKQSGFPGDPARCPASLKNAFAAQVPSVVFICDCHVGAPGSGDYSQWRLSCRIHGTRRLARQSLNATVQHIRNLAAPTSPALSDCALLDRFIAERDEAAFAGLVERHAAMVLGICRRALRSTHNAEDAFQASFLVLARKAASSCKKESLASFLHGVANHIATKEGTLRQRPAERKTRSTKGSIWRSGLVWPG